MQKGKAKARRLQKKVAELISDLTGIPYGKDELIESREMGQSGVDVKLYGRARHLFPFAIECKNQENWSVGTFLKQTIDNWSSEYDFWLLIMAKNHFSPVVLVNMYHLEEYTEAEGYFNILKIQITNKKQWNLQKEIQKARKEIKEDWMIICPGGIKDTYNVVMDIKLFFKLYEQSKFFKERLKSGD